MGDRPPQLAADDCLNGFTENIYAVKVAQFLEARAVAIIQVIAQSANIIPDSRAVGRAAAIAACSMSAIPDAKVRITKRSDGAA